ncbi:hypothetical protein OOK41_09020 [Micromonospora sp. NBC_01655]|uniref:hypothetical protein n=1 Tax=Micromonospora sp. NBC_01655 TaxID=2975983 RepID=UPI0022506915|nr:hypothetical protein [Micromonospora sp. NBC_01655]MCX4470446.1 hypothetical protein [Micromonospora sp. NBC_01655]
MTTDFKALLAAARLPERAVPVCLRGDLTAEFEDLERQLDDALRTLTTSIEGDGSAAIAECMEALREQMAAHTYQFRLRAMTRPRWHQFIGEHPPRKDGNEIDARDRVRGVNIETFFPALVRESVIDPVLDEQEWTLLLDEALTDRQFDELASAAWDLNRGGVDIPFSPVASRMTRGSGSE